MRVGVIWNAAADDDRLALEEEARAEGEGTPRVAAVFQRHGVEVAVDRHDLPDEVVSDLLDHRCLRIQFSSGHTPIWEFERAGEVVRELPTAATPS